MSKNNGLSDLLAIENDARDFGFEWPNIEMILDQVSSECDEIREAIANHEPVARIQEEIGDLLHTAISLCRFAGFDTEETLSKSASKFSKRMQALKEVTKQRGLDDLHGQTILFMLELWKEVKLLEK